MLRLKASPGVSRRRETEGELLDVARALEPPTLGQQFPEHPRRPLVPAQPIELRDLDFDRRDVALAVADLPREILAARMPKP